MLNLVGFNVKACREVEAAVAQVRLKDALHAELKSEIEALQTKRNSTEAQLKSETEDYQRERHC